MPIKMKKTSEKTINVYYNKGDLEITPAIANKYKFICMEKDKHEKPVLFKYKEYEKIDKKNNKNILLTFFVEKADRDRVFDLLHKELLTFIENDIAMDETNTLSAEPVVTIETKFLNQIKKNQGLFNFEKFNSLESVKQTHPAVDALNSDAVEEGMHTHQSGFVEVREATKETEAMSKKFVSDVRKLIDSHCVAEQAQSLNASLSIEEGKFYKRFGENAISQNDINDFNNFLGRKLEAVVASMKVNMDPQQLDINYREYHSNLLTKLNTIKYVPSKEASEGLRSMFHAIEGMDIDIGKMMSSQNHFIGLRKELNAYENEIQEMDENLLSSARYNDLKKELVFFNDNVVEKFETFNPLQVEIEKFSAEVKTDFTWIKQKLGELKEENQHQYINGLTTLQEKLNKVSLQLQGLNQEYATLHSMQACERIQEEVGNLLQEVHAINSKDFRGNIFNNIHQRYLRFKQAFNDLMSSPLILGEIIDCSFNGKLDKKLSTMEKYSQTLASTHNALAEEKSRLLSEIKVKTDEIRVTYAGDEHALPPQSLPGKIQALNHQIEDSIGVLSQHRNSFVRSIFWSCFGFFRPEATSARIVKEIKEDLNKLETSVQTTMDLKIS